MRHGFPVRRRGENGCLLTRRKIDPETNEYRATETLMSASARRIIIHLGFPKTGSTTIQGMLAANLDRLGPGICASPKDDLTYKLRKHALKYRRSGHFFYWKLRHDAALREMVRKIDAMVFETLIISDENMIGIEPGKIFDPPEKTNYLPWLKHLDAALSNYDVHYVIYTRKPKSWQRSSYNQAFKMRRVKEPFETWVESHNDLDAPRRIIEAFRTYLGPRLHTLDMAEEIGPDRMMGRFILELAGVSEERIAGITLPPRANESLPLASIELLRLIYENRAFRGRRYRYLTRLFKDHPELFAKNPKTGDN